MLETRHCHDWPLRFGSLGTGDFCIAADKLRERVTKASGELSRGVQGSDASPSMLNQARQNVAARGFSFPLEEADYRDLPLRFDQRFDAVLCLGAIGHMPNED